MQMAQKDKVKLSKKKTTQNLKRWFRNEPNPTHPCFFDQPDQKSCAGSRSLPGSPAA